MSRQPPSRIATRGRPYKRDKISGAGDSAEPRDVLDWAGFDLLDALRLGAELLNARDGRRALLLQRNPGLAPGLRVQMAGGELVTLGGQFGLIAGTRFELWTLHPARGAR